MESPDHPCSRCGAPLPARAAAGFCPRCLLNLGLDGGAGRDGEPAAAPTVEAAAGPTASPEQIGPYRILQVLGEGGMGVVYLAEQAEPIRRRVALKVVKPGMDTREVLARFEAERQALAVMSHPNVARVFDAGVTEQGRPYFVMEYVPGIRITEYCDMRCLSVRERLELFTKVCEAIQHAHQKGVIHRDIKPSNVLVSSEDGKAALKVIDFGLAKATGQQLTARTLFTQHGVLIGTPEYMSPEQAGTTALDVDARTDIYSLGVLLYELLVGALPFDPATLRRAAAVEMLRIIQEEEPPRPTTKVGSLGDTASEVARRRHTDVRSLVRQLRGELEWITMRAMEKDPNRRYPSASELATDVRRHLEDEPVVAGPPSRLYRLRKLVRRNRTAFAAAAVSFAVLLAGVAVSTSLYVRSEAERKRATTEARRSLLEAQALQAGLLEDAGEYATLSREAMRLHRSLLAHGGSDLALYTVNRLAVLREVQKSDIAYDGAEQEQQELRREALDLVNRALDRGDLDAVKAAAILADLLPPDEAAPLARRALARVQEGAAGSDRKTLESTGRLIEWLRIRAIGRNTAADDGAFEEVYRESLARLGGLLPARSPTLAKTQQALASVLERKASRLLRAGDAEAAAPVCREALDLLGESGQAKPARTAKLRSDLAASLILLGRPGEAEQLLLEALRVLEKGEEDASTQVARSRLADLYTASNRPADAARVRSLLPEVFVEEAWDLGPLRYEETVASRRGARSAIVGKRSVWVFADTKLSRPGPDGSPLRQATVAWTDRLDARDGLAPLQELKDDSGLPSEFLPLTEDDRAFNDAHNGENCVAPCGAGWALAPDTVVADPERDRLLVFYRRMLRRGLWQEEDRAGASLAAWTRDHLGFDRPVARPGKDVPTIHFEPDEPEWGSAALVVSGQMYVYACENQDLNWPCRLARVPVAAALDRSQWRFFAGSGRWSSDWRDAQPVIPGGVQGGVLSVHWNPFLGKFMALSSNPLDARIAVRLANHPEGPWADAGIAIDTLHSGPGWFWTNTGLGHPELARDAGRIEYVTYWRNTDWRSEIRLMEVHFARKQGPAPVRP